ncbi:LacI family DNA-binding transcriptional regulator [Glycomyces albidus]|uniref:LacI family DNA-binding transcriptional regulator n=1 Tax=Glycomyces albidus TaxID=2656774 RepID=A0A6L5GCI4_9ACTN|nr:LacI family DNA-binding transcriptional regulator [Glycomyces albidus]MQM27350.1 LacI family DNA-binding transcriptional regulator [Glycomyces albidus]
MVKRGKITMNDVAQLAGVSTMTVSNVINDRVRVSPEARERVLAAIRESGYQINAAARSLRSGRSGVIGLAVPQVGNPYFGMFAELVIAEARRHGYHIAVEQTGAVALGETAAVAQSRRLQLDGLILSLSTAEAESSLLQTTEQGLPIVVLGEQDPAGRFDHVSAPDEAGAAAATAHLVDLGCKRIAVVTGGNLDRLTMFTRRYNGYRTALEDRGIRPDPKLRFIVDSLTREGARSTGHRIADSGLGVDGVVALNDIVAMGVIRGLRDRGVAVPDDMRVIGFDDVPAAAYFIPSLSTVSPDHEWKAAKAVELILSRIEDPLAPPREYTAPFAIVRRESTA